MKQNLQFSRRVFISLAACGSVLLSLGAEAMTFKLSTIGYHPQGAKVAILEDVPDSQKVEVVVYDPTRRNPKFPVLLGATVHKVSYVQELKDRKTQGPATRTLLIDFSDFNQAGNYELRVEGTDVKSSPIKIHEFLYWDTLKPVIKSFYFQRCGQEVEDRVAKAYHVACHLKDALPLKPMRRLTDDEEQVDVIGGWHNGGDYAKYVTSTALSAAKLMAMDEWEPKPYRYFRMDYPLFEQGYGLMDDLHHEIKAGLDWMMVMQRLDGAVFRKVAGKQWPGKVMPDADEQPRYIFGVSTQDTAAAAATWAMAARDFKKVDLGYSVKSLMAAEKAWAFLESHPNMLVDQSEFDFTGSGEFIAPGTKTDVAYRLWAAAELYVTTGKEKYHRYFQDHIGEVSLQRFSWQNPAFQGVTDYLLYASNPDEKLVKMLKKSVLHMADTIAGNVEADPYGTGLVKFGPSSNQEVAEQGAILMVAHRLSGKEKYRQAASRIVSYFFGINPLGQTYVTGFPGSAVSKPTHGWVETSGKPILGLVVDGPNEYATDGVTPKGAGAASYVDEFKAFSVNEPKLLNAASLSYLLGTLNQAYNVPTKGAPVEPSNPLDFKLAPERPARRP